jgi:hypothetical protein
MTQEIRVELLKIVLGNPANKFLNAAQQGKLMDKVESLVTVVYPAPDKFKAEKMEFLKSILENPANSLYDLEVADLKIALDSLYQFLQ